MRIGDVARLLRPGQWYKNLILFVPLVFSNSLGTPGVYRPALFAFAGFCLLSSGMYAWNDVVDRAADAAHPRKRTRPVASGAVSAAFAGLLGSALVLAGLWTLSATNPATLVMGALYVFLQVAYSLFLKRQALVDVIAIGLGFVLRAVAGTTAIEVGDPTAWLILCTFLFAIFLALAKRRHEVLLLEAEPERPVIQRAALDGYGLGYTAEVTNITAALLLMSYFLYTFFGTTPWMMLTVPFAVFGVYRYLLLVHRVDLRSETEMLFRDRALLVAALGWVAVAALVLRGLPEAGFEWLEALPP